MHVARTHVKKVTVAMVLGAVAILFSLSQASVSASAFAVGDTVEVFNTGASGLVVRGPGPCDPQVGGKFDGDKGEVVEGPVFCDGHNRWKIQWEDGLVGWSAESWLRKVAMEPPPEGAVHFNDSILEQAVREELGLPPGAEITTADMERLTNLEVQGRGIQDLTGLEHAVNLRRSRAEFNQISDVSPLGGLSHLLSLSLGHNQIQSIAPLVGLTDLEFLNIEHNQVADVSPIAGMQQMRQLVLSGNTGVQSIAPVSGMSHLEFLGISGTQVSDLTPIAGYTGLRMVRALDAPLSDLSPLQSHLELEFLEARNNSVSDLSPLEGLVELRHLHIESAQIADVSPVAGLESLERLGLDGNQIQDIFPLADLNGLRILHISMNPIGDLSPLGALTSLEELRADHLAWDGQLHVLSDLTNLEILTLGTSGIRDVAPLQGLLRLRELQLPANDMTDIGQLVANSDAGGLGSGDVLNLRHNLLDTTPGSKAMQDVQTLVDRGVIVHLHPQRTETGAAPIIIASLSISPPAPYSVGQTLTARFTIANHGNAPITLTSLTAGGRLDGVSDCYNTGFICPDFTHAVDIRLDPGDSYDYEGTFTPSQAGEYEFQVFYDLGEDDWHWNVPTESGVSNSAFITVAPEPQGFTCANVSQIPMVECEALVALYESADGPNWTNNTGWLGTNTPCDWHGVGCSSGRVISLVLMSNNLNGNLPPDLGDLSNLQRLILAQNHLTGEIPSELTELANLRSLVLSENELTGEIPSGLDNLTQLEQLFLGINQLTGPIPAALGSLINLRELGLGGNALIGSIPHQLGNLENLQFLSLEGNQLSGEVPPELGDLQNLERLRIDGNLLTGPLPASLTHLTLALFWFHGTDLCEPPDDPFQAWLAGIGNVFSTGVLCGDTSAADVSGIWSGTGATNFGTGTFEMDLTQSGTMVTGSWEDSGGLQGSLEGTVQGNAMQFTVTGTVGGCAHSIIGTAAVETDTMFIDLAGTTCVGEVSGQGIAHRVGAGSQFEVSMMVTDDQVLNGFSTAVMVDVDNVGTAAATNSRLMVVLPPGFSVVDGPLLQLAGQSDPANDVCTVELLGNRTQIECAFGTLPEGTGATMGVEVQAPICVRQGLSAQFAIHLSASGHEEHTSLLTVQVLPDTPHMAPCRQALTEHVFPVFHFAWDETYLPTNFYFDGDLDLGNNHENYLATPEASEDRTVYINVVEDGEHIVIQYWLYYVFDDKSHIRWVSSHDHDWENVQIYIPKSAIIGLESGERTIADITPEWVRFAAHEGAPITGIVMFCKWDVNECFRPDGAKWVGGRSLTPIRMEVFGPRPAVYVALHQHGTYPSLSAMPPTDQPTLNLRILRQQDFANIVYIPSSPEHGHVTCLVSGSETKFALLTWHSFWGTHPVPGGFCGHDIFFEIADPRIWPSRFDEIAAPWEDEDGRHDGESRWVLVEAPPEPTNQKVRVPRRLVAIAVLSPVSFQVIAPSGHATGVDPDTGLVVTEIPGSTYVPGNESIGAGVVLITDAAAGDYVVQVLGLDDGTYGLDIGVMTTGVVITEQILTDVPITTGETQERHFEVPQVGGGPGFWANRARDELPKPVLDWWAAVMDDESGWLVLEAAEVFPGIAAPATFNDLLVILQSEGGSDMTKQFLRHYAVLRLNLHAGFVDADQLLNLAGWDSSGLVFAPTELTVADVVQAIEQEAFVTDQGPRSEERKRLEIMKDVVEAINSRAG